VGLQQEEEQKNPPDGSPSPAPEGADSVEGDRHEQGEEEDKFGGTTAAGLSSASTRFVGRMKGAVGRAPATEEVTVAGRFR
jgi:hypothetical protein